MALERTFGIIKPDAVKNGHTGEILAMIQKDGFKVVGMRMRRLAKHEAEAFYAVHKERPFYSGLVTFMTEGPVVVLALEREGAIAWPRLDRDIDAYSGETLTDDERLPLTINDLCLYIYTSGTTGMP